MTYPLTIDYSQSIKSLIKRGDYAWASKNINETNFPSSENGEVKIGVELISFGEDKSSENALKEIKKMHIALSGKVDHIFYQCLNGFNHI